MGRSGAGDEIGVEGIGRGTIVVGDGKGSGGRDGDGRVGNNVRG